jgi:MFS family permease
VEGVVAGLTTLFGDDGDLLHERDFQVLVLVNLLAPLGIPLVSPVLSSLTGPFDVNEATVGLLISAYTAPPILLIPVVGVLADRFGRKPMMLAGVLCFGVGGTAIAFTTDFRVALALRLLQGVGFAGLTPMVITSIGDLYSGTREATAQGIRFMTSGIYQAVFPLVSGVVVALAWQYPFYIYAIAFPVALAVFVWFREPMPEKTGGRSDGDATTEEDATTEDGGSLRDLLHLVTRPKVFAIVLARGLPMIIWVGFLTYNSILVVRLMGGTPGQAGLLVTVESIALAAGASQAGRIMDAFESRALPLVGSNVALVGGLVAIVLTSSLAVAVAGAFVLGFGFGVALSLYRSLVTAAAPTRLRGGLVSLAESFGRMTSTLTPIAMGAAIGALSASVPFATAVTWTIVGVAIGTGALGVLLVGVARAAPDVDPAAYA